jgi:hypothetical protein
VKELIEKLASAHDNADSYAAIRYRKGAFNAEIATALWGERRASGSVEGPQTLVWWDGGVGRSVAPDFVGSLDAALTLVPQYRMWFIGHTDPSDMRFTATISLIENLGCETWVGHSPIPAVAMCIAALRARESNQK